LRKSRSLLLPYLVKLPVCFKHDPDVVIKEPPFDIPPIALKMAWSALLHHDAGHIWLRRLISDVASEMNAG